MGVPSSHLVCKRLPPTLEVKVLKKTTPKTGIVGFYARACVVHLGKPLPSLQANDSYVTEIAALSRIIGVMPTVNVSREEHFYKYSIAFIRKLLTPLSLKDVPTFEEWIADERYPNSRKHVLVLAREELRHLKKSDLGIKAFIKYDPFPADTLNSKPPRAIYAPDDNTKVVLGPIFNAIDKKLFKLTLAHGKLFVKGTQPRDWPQLMFEKFGNSRVVTTDFSSMESIHEKAKSRIVYYWMMHMVRNLPHKKLFHSLVHEFVMGCHKIKFNHIRAQVPERLMSGVQWTSSSNSLLNMLILSYLTALKHSNDVDVMVDYVSKNFNGLFEGDDGITLDDLVDNAPEISRDLGVLLKFEKFSSFDGAGFCSVYFDAQAGNVLTDPKKVLRKIFLFPKKYLGRKDSFLDALLRARAMSLLYNYHSCPIVSDCCHWLLQVTSGVDLSRVLDALDSRELETLRLAMNSKPWLYNRKIPDSSRILMTQCYGIDELVQKNIEKQFNIFQDACRRGFLTMDLYNLYSDIMVYWSDMLISDDPDYKFQDQTSILVEENKEVRCKRVVDLDLKWTNHPLSKRTKRSFSLVL